MKQFVLFLASGLISLSTVYGSHFSSEECCPSNESGKFIVSADLLALQPHEKGLELCTFDVNYSLSSDGRVISDFQGKKHHPNFKWDPGFRLGAGYTLCSFQAEALWTHFDTRSCYSNNESRIKWRLNFDTLDAVAGYLWQATDSLTITSIGGIRAAWIDQKIHSETYIENKGSEKFFGAGPLMGLDAHVNIGCGFNVYVNAALFWLFGHYQVVLQESYASENGSTFSKIKNNEHAAQFGGDAALGIEWCTAIFNKEVSFRLGLEHHHYFDYNYLGGGALILDGAVGSCHFVF